MEIIKVDKKIENDSLRIYQLRKNRATSLRDLFNKDEAGESEPIIVTDWVLYENNDNKILAFSDENRKIYRTISESLIREFLEITELGLERISIKIIQSKSNKRNAFYLTCELGE